MSQAPGPSRPAATPTRPQSQRLRIADHLAQQQRQRLLIRIVGKAASTAANAPQAPAPQPTDCGPRGSQPTMRQSPRRSAQPARWHPGRTRPRPGQTLHPTAGLCSPLTKRAASWSRCAVLPDSCSFPPAHPVMNSQTRVAVGEPVVRAHRLESGGPTVEGRVGSSGTRSVPTQAAHDGLAIAAGTSSAGRPYTLMGADAPGLNVQKGRGRACAAGDRVNPTGLPGETPAWK